MGGRVLASDLRDHRKVYPVYGWEFEVGLLLQGKQSQGHLSGLQEFVLDLSDTQVLNTKGSPSELRHLRQGGVSTLCREAGRR